MSEQLPTDTDDDKWEVSHQSPVMWADLNQDGDKRELHYGNTSIWLFPGAWAVANHVYIQRDDSVKPPLPSCYIFGSQEFMDHLHEQGFPQHSMPWPTDGDVLAFRDWSSKTLDTELNDL